MHEINIRNTGDPDEIAKASEKAWLQLQGKLAQRMQAKWIIHKYWKKFKQNNKWVKGDRLLANYTIQWNLAQMINYSTSDTFFYNVRKLGRECPSLFRCFLNIEFLKRQIINTFYYTYIEDAIDYHYITMQMSEVSHIHTKCVKMMKELILNITPELIDE